MSTKFKNIVLLAGSVFALAACQGQNAGTDTSSESDSQATSEASGDYIGMITDEGGVDDRSFNQSAWEGMQAWSEKTGNKYNITDQQIHLISYQTSILRARWL